MGWRVIFRHGHGAPEEKGVRAGRAAQLAVRSADDGFPDHSGPWNAPSQTVIC